MVEIIRRTCFVMVIGLAVVIGSIMVTSAQDLVMLSIDSPLDGATVGTNSITVSGSALGAPDDAVVSVTVKGIPASGTAPGGGFTSWMSEEITLQPGPNRITVIATDTSDNTKTKILTVFYNAPTPPPTTIPNEGPTPTPTGSISITTIPSGAEVYLDNSPTKRITPATLENVTVGHHKVKVSKEGYRSQTRDIYVCTGITKELNIKLEPITGSIFVSSTPSAASVYSDNVDMNAITPCMLKVDVGPHYIKLTKSDYFDLISNVSVSDSSTPTYLHGDLTGYGSIDISLNPFGASVYLDGDDMNKTTPCILSEVVVGPHTIKLTKFGYFNVTENVSVSVGRTHSVHEHLTECGSIDISSSPSGANVYLDSNYTGVTPTNISKVALGNHTIKLTKSDYFDVIIRNVFVSASETRHLDENLTGYGSFRISSKPSRAEVCLDGVFKGITPLDIDEVVEGSYFIKLTKFWYVAVEKKIDVSAGKRETVDENLSVSPGWTLFAMLVAIALEEAAWGVIRKRIIPFILRSIKEKYLFNWDSVPGDDDEKFKKFLRDDFDIGWAKNAEIIKSDDGKTISIFKDENSAEIIKSDDGKTISIFKDENSAEIIIDEKKEKASLKISDGRTLDLKVKNENGKLNIYKKRKALRCFVWVS